MERYPAQRDAPAGRRAAEELALPELRQIGGALDASHMATLTRISLPALT